jgi:uncharacterized ubiquitin-like protein YukD
MYNIKDKEPMEVYAVTVTVKFAGNSKQYDLEMPADIPISDLIPKLLMAVKNLESRFFLGVDNIRIFSDSAKRYLDGNETLASAGVWDGSYITVEKA